MKGQLFSLDIVFALFLFFIVTMIVLYFWFIIPDNTQSLMQEKTSRVSDYLVSYKLGEENVLDCDQVTGLASQSYDGVKDELNAGRFDVWVWFQNQSQVCEGGEVNIGYNFTNKTYVTSVSRIVILDNETMQMVVRLYE